MSKTSAQLLREHMDSINAVSHPVDEAVSEDRFNFTTTITNPNFNPADEESPEEIEVGVNYNVSGRYYAATMDSPAEYPELEVLDVVDLATGADVTGQVSRTDMQRIEEKAWEDAESAKQAAEDDAAEDRYRDRMDRDFY
jgi:hypothetical protein